MSRQTVYVAIWSFIPVSDTSNFLVCYEQTRVSSEGTTLKSRVLAGVSLIPTILRAPVTHWKSGALSPALSCGPTRVSGLPLNVTALARLCMVWTSDDASPSRYGWGTESLLGQDER